MTERNTSAGPVDIYGVDTDGTPGIVECKRRRVGPDAVSQLERYVTATERELTQHELTWVALDPDRSV